MPDRTVWFDSEVTRRRLLKAGLQGGGGIVLGSSLASVLAACTSSAPAASPSPSASAAAKAVKAAFIYVGPINDHGWTQAHDVARRFAEANVPGLKTSYIENVPETADAQRTIENFANQGYDIIFTTSFGFMDPTVAAAKDFPNAKFEHCSGYKSSTNLATYMAAQEDPRYVSGILAGSMTKSNTLGFLAAFPIPEVIRNFNAWMLGAQSVNPGVTGHVIWTNTWFDPPTEKQAANSLLDIGADVLAGTQDSPSLSQASAARGHYATGSDSDQQSYAPTAVLDSAIFNWGPHYVGRCQAVQNGTWATQQVYYHYKDGIVLNTAPASFVPAAAAQAANTAADGLKTGTLQIWKGPISDNNGNVVVQAGQVLDDAYVQGTMNWLVKGTVGSVPKA
jgi:basic membrane protein A